MKSVKQRLAAFIPRFIGAGTIARFLSLVSVRIPVSQRNAHLAQNSIAWDQIWEKAMKGRYIEYQGVLSSLVLGKLSADRNACEVIATYNTMASLAVSEATWAKKPEKSLRYPWWDVTRRRTFPEMLWEFESYGLALAGYFGTAPGRIVKYLEKHGYETDTLTGKAITAERVRALAGRYRAFVLMAYNDCENIMAQVHTLSITKEAYGFQVHNGNMEDRIFPMLYEAVCAVNQGKSKPIVLIGVGSF